MTVTLAALLFGHVLADFVLQTKGMVGSKRRPLTMALHGPVVLGTAVLAVGAWSPWLIALTVGHVAIDAAKSVLRFGSIANEKEVSEYVIIGTLASFSWAIAVAFATVVILNTLPPLGIPDLLP